MKKKNQRRRIFYIENNWTDKQYEFNRYGKYRLKWKITTKNGNFNNFVPISLCLYDVYCIFYINQIYINREYWSSQMKYFPFLVFPSDLKNPGVLHIQCEIIIYYILLHRLRARERGRESSLTSSHFDWIKKLIELQIMLTNGNVSTSSVSTSALSMFSILFNVVYPLFFCFTFPPFLITIKNTQPKQMELI